MSDALRLDFIVGMSRTGITWLTRVLNLHPQLATFGQSRYWGKHFRPPRDPAGYDAAELDHIRRRLRSFNWDGTVGRGPGCLEIDLEQVRRDIDAAFAGLEAPAGPVRTFMALAQVFATAGGSTHVLEKTPHHVLYVDRIRAHLPRARFVIIEADAQDYAAIQRGQADLRHHPIAVALLYRRYAAACERAASRLGKAAVRVQLRALAEDPVAALAPVLALLEVDPEPLAGMVDRMPALREAVPEPFRAPPPAIDRFWLEQLAGASDLGTRASTFEQLRSLASLPRWVALNLRDNMRDVEGSLLAYYSQWLLGGRR